MIQLQPLREALASGQRIQLEINWKNGPKALVSLPYLNQVRRGLQLRGCRLVDQPGHLSVAGLNDLRGQGFGLRFTF
ncbi:MAG: hypothetical protein BMS9Abin28_0269 [Anaerolineae bacterium]|nr:MAG: hypothetical protein BMS9Abin28_0269 [Anaerolineae bacterium]